MGRWLFEAAKGECGEREKRGFSIAVTPAQDRPRILELD
jgi:hypothetical protein